MSQQVSLGSSQQPSQKLMLVLDVERLIQFASGLTTRRPDLPIRVSRNEALVPLREIHEAGTNHILMPLQAIDLSIRNADLPRRWQQASALACSRIQETLDAFNKLYFIDYSNSEALPALPAADTTRTISLTVEALIETALASNSPIMTFVLPARVELTVSLDRVKKSFSDLVRQQPAEADSEYGSDGTIYGADGRVLETPKNLEAERLLLGYILRNNEAFDRCYFLSGDDFYDEQNKTLFQSAAKLITCGKQATPITLRSFAESDTKIRELGGHEYLKQLANVQAAEAPEELARVISDLAIRRRLAELGEKVILDAFDVSDSIAPLEAVSSAAEKIYALAESGKSRGGFRTIGSVLTDGLDALNNRFQGGGGRLSGAPTGIERLDYICGGLQGQELIVLSGRNMVDCSSLALDIALNVARWGAKADAVETSPQYAVGYFNLSSPSSRFAQVTLSKIAGKGIDRTLTGQLTEEEFRHYVSSAQQSSSIPLFVDDSSPQSVKSIRSVAWSLKRRLNISLLVVDRMSGCYLESASEAESTRTRVLAELKNLANEMYVPIIVVAELPPEIDHFESARPWQDKSYVVDTAWKPADTILFLSKSETKLSDNGLLMDVGRHGEHLEAATAVRELEVFRHAYAPPSKIVL